MHTTMRAAMGLLLVIGCMACPPARAQELTVHYIDAGEVSHEVYTGDMVPDSQTALRIAQAVMAGVEDEIQIKNLMPMSMIYDEEKAVWAVLFTEYGELTCGGAVTVHIQKKDGRILGICAGSE